MKAFFKSKKGIALVVTLLIIALLGVGVGCYFIFGRKVKLDWERGAKAVQIVEDAQYTPDMDNFIEANRGTRGVATLKSSGSNVQLLNSSSPKTASTMTEEQFSKLIDDYATVENYAGAGKGGGYDIYEIKNEIKYVVEKVPAFNQWFRMPDMREEEGYVSIPYYENWAYYLEMDEENRLNITRVCVSTRSSYLDFENQKTIEYHSRGKSFVQYEVMKTKYYENEKGKEVVETFIYSVGVDNKKVGKMYNKNTKDYYPFEYQYLMNVKDESLIKYHITSAKRYWPDETFDKGGMDIRGLTPYGIRREFTIANYDGYSTIDFTKIDQKFATYNHPEYKGSVYFNRNSDNIKKLVKNIGLSNSEYESSTDCMDLLDKIAKQIIDNFEIKNNWQKIYKDSSKAIEIKKIKGPHYGKDFPISDVSVFVGTRNNDITFEATAFVYDMSKFDINKKYSLSMALRNRQTGNLYIVGSDYKLLEENFYNGSETETYFRTDSEVFLNASNIKLSENGEYDVTCVLTVKENGEDVIMFDTLLIGYLFRDYMGLSIQNSVDENGIEHSYKVKGRGGKITIIVSSIE